MSDEYGFNVFNLKTKYDPHSYLLGRFYQTKDTEEEAKLIHKIIMLFEDPDLEEIGIERNCLSETIEGIISNSKRRIWPSYAYSDNEGYVHSDGEKLSPEEFKRRQRKYEAQREMSIQSQVYPIAIKIGLYLIGKNVTVPISTYGEPPKKKEMVEA